MVDAVTAAHTHLQNVKDKYEWQVNFSFVMWAASVVLLIAGMAISSDATTELNENIAGSIGLFSFIVWLFSFILWIRSTWRISDAKDMYNRENTKAIREAQAQAQYQEQLEAWNKLTLEQQNLLRYQASLQKSQTKSKTNGFLAVGNDPLTLAATGIASWFIIDHVFNKD